MKNGKIVVFNCKDTTYLLPTNHDVLLRNNSMMLENVEKILKISPVNSCSSAKKQSSDIFQGLMNLFVGSPVLLLVNLKQEVGLCNGLQGKICDFKFDENNVCSNDISIALSICVWVEFDGYTGKIFFPNDESR